MYCIFATHRYDILINYICLSVFVHLKQSWWFWFTYVYSTIYIFTAYLPYNQYILVRCSYYIVFTYVDFIFCYDFFYNWSWIDNYQFLYHQVVLLYTIVLNYIVCFFICVSYICTYLCMYACKYTFLIYLLHMYCIFARYSYDIVVNYICFFSLSSIFFIVNLITMEMLGIYYGWNDMALWEMFVSLL